MRTIPQLTSGLGGLLIGLAVALAWGAEAQSPPVAVSPQSGGTIVQTAQPMQDSPWGAAGGLTAGAAVLIAVGRLGAIVQKVLDGGVTLTVKLDDDDRAALLGAWDGQDRRQRPRRSPQD